MINTTIELVLYKWKTLANGNHPFMIRITQGGKRTYHAIGENCNPIYWDFKKNKLKARPVHPDHDVLEDLLRKKLTEFNKKRLELKGEDESFTPMELIEKVNKPVVRRTTLLSTIDTLIHESEENGKIGNALVFKDTRRVLSNYLGKKSDPYFSRINKEWLEDYEKYLRELKLSEVTISVYFSTLRSIYNKAIERKGARMEYYPFGKFGFKVSKFDTTTRKRALTKAELITIKNLDLSKHPEAETARRYFLFSYYGWGINFVDMAKLTRANIEGKRIVYVRSKTGKKNNFPITPEIKEILDHFKATRSLDRKEYLFPILNRIDHVTPTQISNRYKKVQKVINKDLKTVAELANVTGDLTFYWMRHSFATQLKRENVSPAIIQGAMKHSNLGTTQIYLDDLEDDLIDDTIRNASAI